MIKRFSIRKILKMTLFIFIVFLFYLFPSENNVEKTSYVSKISNYHDIYLLDRNNYVSKTTISVKSIEREKLANDLLLSLIIDSSNKNKIPNTFNQVIPKNTVIQSVKINNTHITVSFNDNIKNIKQNKNKMIECIVYTLTGINNIKEVELLIDNKENDFFDKIIYTRDIGINKKYDIVSLNDITRVTLYYVSKIDEIEYYVPVTKIINSKDDKIKIIVEELASKSTYESNLMSYLNYETKLMSYNIEEDRINLYFNNSILSSKEDNKILEEVRYSISNSISDTMNVSNIHYYIDNEEF